MTPEREIQLVRLSAALAARDKGAASEAMQALARDGDPVEVEEAILQSYLFLGFPVALNGFALWRRVSGRDAAPAEPADLDAWTARGEEVIQQVYDGQYDGLRANIAALHTDLDRWMVTEGYGKVLGRPGLGLQERELCVVAALAVVQQPKQLFSHLRGALNVGCSPDRIERALGVADPYLDEAGQALARRTWDKVRARRGIETSGAAG